MGVQAEGRGGRGGGGGGGGRGSEGGRCVLCVLELNRSQLTPVLSSSSPKSSILYIAAIYTVNDADAMKAVVYTVTAMGGVGQFLCEPCLYEVAGLLPTMDATNAVAVGTGFSGVLNWAVKIIISEWMTRKRE